MCCFAGGGGFNDAEVQKLRKALADLQEVSAEDKELISTQSALLDELEEECSSLKAFKAEAEETIAELRSAGDDMSSYETMIERLTEDNLELTAQVRET